MFTGIIEELGQVTSVEKFKDSWRISTKTSLLDDLSIGNSIAVNGVCLTIVNIDDNLFSSDVVKETLGISNLNLLKKNDFVNIERCMKINDRINGHMVQGHVEGIAKIVSKEKGENETSIIIEVNENLLKYCIHKGSICLDGISLTIAKIIDNRITVAIIPHTLVNTTLGLKKVDDILNVETDMLSKYVEKLII